MLSINNNKCTACGACINACPQKCISLKQERDGFVYPTIDLLKCKQCSVCDNVCPIEKNHNHNYNSKAYAGVHNSISVVNKSTSGGAFSAIALHILKNNGVVYGCAYNSELKPIHIRIDTKEKLHYINGSKYIQSDTIDTFQKAKKDLDSGKSVLYSGTPCQISGLKAFLKKDYENLLTVDIICHGVPSYAYFKKYIDWLEKTDKVKIRDFKFRTKNNSGWRLSGTYSGTYSGTGKNFVKRINYFDSYYYFYFLHSEIYRECCYSCEYANMERQGDFTLGDLWGAEGFNLRFDTSMGCSLILANSEKAKEIIDKLDLQIVEINVEDAIKHNEQLRTPSKRPDSRKRILKQYIENDGNEINNYFLKNNRKHIFIGRVKYAVPDSIKMLLLKKRYK